MKHLRGEYLGPVAPYGYQKSATIKNHIEPDEEAAEIIYRIHCMKFFDGLFPQQIARILEAEGIPIPCEYLKQRGSKVYFNVRDIKGWNQGTVKRILRNSIYLGVTVSEKSRAMETGSNRKVTTPRENWLVIERTHEPIVPWRIWLENQKPLRGRKKNNPMTEMKDIQDVYNPDVSEGRHLPQGMAERIIKRDKISSIKSGEHMLPEELRDSPVKSKVWCANCGNKMMRHLGRKRIYYLCNYRYHNAQGDCMRGGFREDRLMELVLASINQQITAVADLRKYRDIEEQKRKEHQRAVQGERKRLEHRRLSLKHEKLELFEKYQAGVIGKEKYQALKGENSKSLEEVEKEYAALESQSKDTEEEGWGCLDLYEGKQVVHQLTKELVEELVDRIILYDKEHVEIQFRYMDEIERLVRCRHDKNQETTGY